MKSSRREFLRESPMLAGLAFSGAPMVHTSINSDQKPVAWPLSEGADTPRMVLGLPVDADSGSMRRLKQIGVNYVSSVWGPGPWDERALRGHMNNFKAQGLTLINVMYIVGPNIVLGREGRDKDIRNIQDSIRAAGACGLPTVEYNFYVDRLIEGYYEKEGRGGSGLTAFDYSRVKDLPSKPEIGVHKADELWRNLLYFLKAVIPVAEKANVRLALHPNDPVARQSHGSDQIIANVAGLKKLITLVDSPSNGITFDSGVIRQMGDDPVEICRYFASRDRINHVHYRNVISEIKYEKYTEVFLDEGQVNMLAVMQELFKHHYTRGLYAEHPFILDYDKEHPGGEKRNGNAPGGGGYAAECFNVGFTRAMMLAVMSGCRL
ncbi:MAG TPA: mannonate dehydratase [Chryseolinea sp.]|nr:mannonate dehydratase [Chryseolinea sp.]